MRNPLQFKPKSNQIPRKPSQIESNPVKILVNESQKPNQAKSSRNPSQINRNPKRSQPKASRNPGKVLVNESQIKPKPSRSSSRKPAEGLRSQPAGARSQPSPDRRESAVTADRQAGFLEQALLNCHTMSTGPLTGAPGQATEPGTPGGQLS